MGEEGTTVNDVRVYFGRQNAVIAREVGWIQNVDKGNNSGNGHKMPNILLMLFMEGSEWKYFDVFKLITFAF